MCRAGALLLLLITDETPEQKIPQRAYFKRLRGISPIRNVCEERSEAAIT